MLLYHCLLHSGEKIRFLKILLRNFTDLSLQFVPTFAFSLPSSNYCTSCKMAELTYNLMPTEALVVDSAESPIYHLDGWKFEALGKTQRKKLGN